MHIAIVTDSTSDIPPDIAAEAGIKVMPLILNIGQQSFRDAVDISREDFYNELPVMPDLPTTAAPAPGEFIELYTDLLKEADAVISIHVASGLSGVYTIAAHAAGEVDAQRIKVIDSGQISMGIGWAVLAAAEAANSGATLDEALAHMHDTMARVRVFAIFNTMEYLHKGGRINWLQAGVSSALDLKAMLEMANNEVISRARIRTWGKAMNRLVETARSLGSFEKLAVMHSNCIECTTDLLSHIKPILPATPPLTVDVTPVIGTHVGPHAVGFAAVLAEATDS